jgi:phage gp29-like protein
MANSGLTWERAPHRAAGRLTVSRYPVGSTTDLIVGYEELKKRFGVMRKMERDPVVASALALKKWLPVGEGWRIYPAGETPAHREQADFARWALEQLDGTVEQFIGDVLDAVGIGFSVIEKVYRVVEGNPWSGKLALSRLVPKDPSTVGFELDKYGAVRAITFTVPGEMIAEPLPREKFVHYAYESRYRSPYGSGDLIKAYRSWWSKDNALKWWAMYVEKYGVTPRVGRYEDGAGVELQQEILEQLRVSAANTEFVLPKSVELQLLQPEGDGAAFERFVQYHDKELAKAILGNTLLLDEGQRVGSLALGKVHLEVVEAHVRRLKREIEDRVVGEQVIRQLVDLNFPSADGYPRFSLPDARKEELAQLAGAIAKLIEKGAIDPSEPWIRESLGFPGQASE